MEIQNTLGGGRWRIVVWGAIAAIIALPAVAMQFTDEVQWTAFDFLFALVLLGGATLLFEAIRLMVRRRLWRGIVAAGLVLVVALIWIEGAVGLFH